METRSRVGCTRAVDKRDARARGSERKIRHRRARTRVNQQAVAITIDRDLYGLLRKLLLGTYLCNYD